MSLGEDARSTPAARSGDASGWEPVSPAEFRAFRLAQRGRGRRGRRRERDEAPAVERPAPGCEACRALDGYVPPDEISGKILLMVGKRQRGRIAKSVEVQRARGVVETGLEPAFIGGADCPEIDSEKWAIDYSHKRPWPALHKGIDIPQPRGTPILAIAAGTVVGKFLNDDNRKGIEVMLRHTPAQTGLPFWTYSQYTHLREMSPLPIGSQVKMGQEIGATANTGKMGRRIRRDALHMAVFYSRRAEWSNNGVFVIPKEGYWMDPNAFYRADPPYKSQTLAELPDDQKRVAVAHMNAGGAFVPPDTQRIWPYRCE